MESILLVLSVVALFLVRVGIPVILLIVLGIVIERWQRSRENEIQHYLAKHPKAH